MLVLCWIAAGTGLVIGSMCSVAGRADERSGYGIIKTKYKNYVAEDGQRVKCGYCGNLFISIGDTDKYEHNWVNCKADKKSNHEIVFYLRPRQAAKSAINLISMFYKKRTKFR